MSSVLKTATWNSARFSGKKLGDFPHWLVYQHCGGGRFGAGNVSLAPLPLYVRNTDSMPHELCLS